MCKGLDTTQARRRWLAFWSAPPHPAAPLRPFRPYSVADVHSSETFTHVHKAQRLQARAHTYPSPQAPEAVHFGFGGHEVVEAVGEGLLGLLGRLGVVGNSRG